MKIDGGMFIKIMTTKYYDLKGRSNFDNEKPTYEKGYCNFIFDILFSFSENQDYKEVKNRINKAYLLKSEKKRKNLDEFSKGYLDAIDDAYNIINSDIEDLIR